MSEPIIFKCEDSLWQMMADGKKKFDMRLWDMADDRMYRLSWAQYGESISEWTSVPRGERPTYTPKESFVSFRNKQTDELLTFHFKGLEFPQWAPSWVFIIVGDLVSRTQR